MPPSNSLVVADTGPLIALARINLQECEAKPDRGEGKRLRAAIEAGLFQLLSPIEPLPNWRIDPGETSAIALALEKQAGVLMDDKAGRKVARQQGLAVIGTAGVLVLASVRQPLDALLASGYFLGADVVAEAGVRLDSAGQPGGARSDRLL